MKLPNRGKRKIGYWMVFNRDPSEDDLGFTSGIQKASMIMT